MSTYVQTANLSGVEAEIIRVAVERFRKDNPELGVDDYKFSISTINDVYIILFRNSDNGTSEAVHISYDVEVSAKTLKVVHSQFSR